MGRSQVKRSLNDLLERFPRMIRQNPIWMENRSPPRPRNPLLRLHDLEQANPHRFLVLLI